jgi:phage tail sheath protein FI
MAVIKTPGVYVEEISLFPPSIAETDPSVPAFIGHTEIARKIAEDDLTGVPLFIDSMLAYEQYFIIPCSYSLIMAVENAA